MNGKVLQLGLNNLQTLLFHYTMSLNCALVCVIEVFAEKYSIIVFVNRLLN